MPACAAAAGLGIGLSSVAATGLGTEVERAWRGGAAGIINTAAQVGTAVGVAALLLIAAATSGVPGRRAAPRRRGVDHRRRRGGGRLGLVRADQSRPPSRTSTAAPDAPRHRPVPAGAGQYLAVHGLIQS